MVDWCSKEDLLRCNPKFWGRPRYDFAIATIPPRGQVFVRLVFLFTCKAGTSVHPLALVQALDRHPRTGDVRNTDKKLSILRWNLRLRTRCEIVPVDSIVRGAVLIPDTKYAGDYFVVDTLDADMFLRARVMHS
jgi:hypothetical protein